ncbi:MAG TPA: acetylglutamate kinase [Clostridia bacterium]
MVSRSRLALNNQLRLLWEQHVVWTRLTIISMVFDLPDVDPVTGRLLRNPKDFEALLKPLYGDGTAARFADLLTSHLVIAAELVKAAKAGDTGAAADAEKRWYANADEIAVFLGSINPCWSARQWQAMLREHLALTKSEAVNILTGKYAEGITVFDQIEKQALEMADVMVNGIIRQFPNI